MFFFSYKKDAEKEIWQSFLQKSGDLVDVVNCRKFDGDGIPERSTEECFANPSPTCVVSVNKMRGMFSAQVEKWGSYQLRRIDYAFLKTKRHCVSADPVSCSFQLRPHQDHDPTATLQKWPRDLLESLTEDTDMERILKLNEEHPFMDAIAPNAVNPSDHMPIHAKIQAIYALA